MADAPRVERYDSPRFAIVTENYDLKWDSREPLTVVLWTRPGARGELGTKLDVSDLPKLARDCAALWDQVQKETPTA